MPFRMFSWVVWMPAMWRRQNGKSKSIKSGRVTRPNKFYLLCELWPKPWLFTVYRVWNWPWNTDPVKHQSGYHRMSCQDFLSVAHFASFHHLESKLGAHPAINPKEIPDPTVLREYEATYCHRIPWRIYLLIYHKESTVTIHGILWGIFY